MALLILSWVDQSAATDESGWHTFLEHLMDLFHPWFLLMKVKGNAFTWGCWEKLLHGSLLILYSEDGGVLVDSRIEKYCQSTDTVIISLLSKFN